MRGVWTGAAAVLCLSIGLAACEGAAHGACESADDLAFKMTALTDDLKKAQSAGKISDLTAGEIGARIMEAGRRHDADKNRKAFCTALDQIRFDAKL